MSRKNMDDIFRDGLKNYSSDIDPNEIWAGIQDKQPNPSSDSKRPFAWWIIGAVLLMASASVLLGGVANKQRNAIETAEANLSQMGMLNTNSKSGTTAIKEETTNIAEKVDQEVEASTISTTTSKSIANNEAVNSTSVSKKKALTAENKNKVAPVKVTTKISSNTVYTDSNQFSAKSTPQASTTFTTRPDNFYANRKITSQPLNSISKPKSSINKMVAFEFLNREAIPVIPMTDDEQVDFAEVDIPKVDFTLEEIEEFEKIADGCYRQPKFSIAVGAHLGPDLVMHRISSTNQDLFPYIDERRKTEKLLESYHVGLDVYLQHKDGLFLRSGVEYAQINKRFKFDATWINKDDSLNTVTTFVREKRTTNRYRMIDVPLTAGYEFSINEGDIRIYVEGGASMNVLFKKKGDILNPIPNTSSTTGEFFEPISITDGEEEGLDGYVDNIGLSILGGIGIRYELMDGLSVYAQPAGKLYLNSFTKKDNDVNEKFSRFGLNLGVIYKL